jgi:two-component system chemotaxis sensor kinase CheA
MEIDLERFRETFFQEASEHVAQMEAGLLAMAAGDVNLELLNAVFRGAHSIKGAAGTFGLAEITDFTHAMESLLDGMRSGQLQAEKGRIDLLLEAVDVLAAMLESARQNGPFPANAGAIRERLTAARGAAPEITAPVHSDRAGAIRVTTDKVDRLVDLVGELVITQSMAAQALQGFTMARLPELTDTFADMERHTRELQERIMGVRMRPVAGVFHRMQRLVRDLAMATGKAIALEISGEDTEIDKSIVKGIADPLTHIVRNAAGNLEEGHIRLSARHEGGCALIEVSGDGRELDGAKVRLRAAERGMDVVRRNVEAMSGSVTVESEAGHGSTVRLRLPLTLAILEGLLARVGADTYILPLASILESVRPKPTAVRMIAGQGEVVMLRGEPVPLVRLHRLFRIPGAVTSAAEGITVIVEHQGRRLALLADQLLGQQQVVIKSLEGNHRRVDGVAGATFLGDGRPALIVDVPGIANMASMRGAAAA